MISKITDIDVEVGKRLYELREVRGVTRRELAKALGMTYQQLHKYELGVNRLSCGNLCKIAKYLDLPANAFLGEEYGGRYVGAYEHLNQDFTVNAFSGKLNEITDKYIRGLLFGMIEYLVNQERNNVTRG